MPELFRLDKRVTSRLKAALDREWEALLLMADDEPIPQRDIPSEAQLQSLVSAIFWASFEREEARQLKFGVAFRQPFDWKGALVFSDPLAFNIETMRKLAPALVDGQNYFGVWPFEGDELKIWGITAYEGDTHLQIIDPGRIILRFRSTNIAALTGQSVRRIDFERMITDMRRLFVASETAIAPIARRMFYLEALFWLLSGMRSYGHGGTVLFVVPGQSTWVSSIKQPIVNALSHPGEAIRARIDTIRSSADRKAGDRSGTTGEIMGRLFMNSPDGQQLIRHVKDAVFEIATLTSVDGATVLDLSFDVLAFGVKITPTDPDKAPHEITRHSPFRGEESTTVRLADLGGTRHQSAAQFVYDQHEAVAIVASQDGNVSLFYWGYGENRVQVIQNLEVILDY